jgi:hypothetical protein
VVYGAGRRNSVSSELLSIPISVYWEGILPDNNIDDIRSSPLSACIDRDSGVWDRRTAETPLAEIMCFPSFFKLTGLHQIHPVTIHNFMISALILANPVFLVHTFFPKLRTYAAFAGECADCWIVASPPPAHTDATASKKLYSLQTISESDSLPEPTF